MDAQRHLTAEEQLLVETVGEAEQPGLHPDDSMSRAGRKVLRFHFVRMLKNEPGTRLGEDIEALHDMRVATRRMRAAFRVFGDFFDSKAAKVVIEGLRGTGRALGAVRDLDVFWAKTERYLETLPAAQRGDLAPLRAAWEAERERAREAMLAYLDSADYGQFRKDFVAFLQSPAGEREPRLSKKGKPRPYRLRHVVPVSVYKRLAAMRAYDDWVTGPDVPLTRLHRLRITAKRLRYTLEFFQEVLGPEVTELIKAMKRLQDHLGDLQDAVVAGGLLGDFLHRGTWGTAETGEEAGAPAGPVAAPGVEGYLVYREEERQHLVETFPQAWAYFQGPAFRQTVAAAVAAL